jgi:hypothetical protein
VAACSSSRYCRKAAATVERQEQWQQQWAAALGSVIDVLACQPCRRYRLARQLLQSILSLERAQVVFSKPHGSHGSLHREAHDLQSSSTGAAVQLDCTRGWAILQCRVF